MEPNYLPSKQTSRDPVILNLIQDIVQPMPQHKRSYVYTLANHSRSIYVGNTSNLEKQVWQHRLDLGAIHTSRFNISRLVWFEQSDNIRVAFSREKQIKNWRRSWKIDLVEKNNSQWRDLAEAWFDSRCPESSSGRRWIAYAIHLSPTSSN